MTIPDFQSIMLPFLKYMADGKEHSLRETYEALADEFELTEEEKEETLPSGLQGIFLNRVGWARTYLKKAGLIESRVRAHFNITDRSREVLNSNPKKINIKLLEQFDEFVEFRAKKSDREQEPPIRTPEEVLENAYQEFKMGLASELIQKIKSCSPKFFERLVVELLVKMGYGGTRKDAGEAIGQTGDGGIDGIIKEDRLGLDIVYIQAKRWDNVVGSPEIQKFAGALLGKKGKKGIFITTSSFSKASVEYAQSLDNKVVLIDGEQLAQYMIDFNVGVTPLASYDIKRMDLDFFEEE